SCPRRPNRSNPCPQRRCKQTGFAHWANPSRRRATIWPPVRRRRRPPRSSRNHVGEYVEACRSTPGGRRREKPSDWRASPGEDSTITARYGVGNLGHPLAFLGRLPNTPTVEYAALIYEQGWDMVFGP